MIAFIFITAFCLCLTIVVCFCLCVWKLDRETFDLARFLEAQKSWSEKTFGPGDRTFGICEHIREELNEVESSGGALIEWIDVVILALDGAWRSGHAPADIIEGLAFKFAANRKRRWPDWRKFTNGEPIKHLEG